MTSNLKWLGWWVMVALIFAACSTSLRVVPTPQVTSTSIFVVTARMASTPTSRPTRTPQPTETVAREPRVTPPASPTGGVNSLKVYEIENGSDGKDIETAYWSADGNTVCYAFCLIDDMDKELQWAAYDVATHFTQTVSSPQKCDSRIWKRLNIPKPRLLDTPIELRGQISPSGKHVIYVVGYGSDGVYATPDPNVRSRTEIWTADSTGEHRVKLTEFPGAGYGVIWQADWLEDETRVIFGMHYEYGVRFYIADLKNDTVVPLADVSEFKRGTEYNWAVSPDGSTLAVIAFDGTLWLVPLNGSKAFAIEKYALQPFWAKDSKTVYYWWGSEFPPNTTIRAYVLSSGKKTGVIDGSSLESNVFPGAYFAIAPHGDKTAFWGGGLWLAELPK
ncbi:hypothetical protein TFLX_05860 [Thermoflexales bacterium]|nr:hypothetical protein TFLX_05860 [Thermoflexales bacterium]